MCIFSGPVTHVSRTRIFARLAVDGRQFLAYEMRFEAPGDLAMVLPLPMADRRPTGDLQFLDLSGYPDFFLDLDRAFPEPAASFELSFGAAPQLPVESVGSFEASYVPTRHDFGRLDPRFRMPDQVWDALPSYRDYAFAVFKLKPGTHQVHPMAFSFRTSLLGHAFFPTVHVHDGNLHDSELFDHSLYVQSEVIPRRWDVFPFGLDQFVPPTRAKGLVVPGVGAGFLRMDGRHPNKDVVVEIAASAVASKEEPRPAETPRKPGLRPGLVRKSLP